MRRDPDKWIYFERFAISTLPTLDTAILSDNDLYLRYQSAGIIHRNIADGPCQWITSVVYLRLIEMQVDVLADELHAP